MYNKLLKYEGNLMSATRKKMAEFLGNTERTVENWEKEDRHIMKFIRLYLNNNSLIDEFLNTGKISKFEQSTETEEKINFNENIMIDNAIYSTKSKYIKLFDDGFFNLARPAKSILYDVIESIDKNDESYTLENAKQRLIDQIKGLELNWYNLKAKNPAKQELLYQTLELYFSKVEVYVMIKHREETFKFGGFFGESKPPK